MTENLNPETVEAVASPSKFAVLKSKITREGLILGGIAVGAIIAGAHVLLKAQASIGEIEGSDTSSETPDVFAALVVPIENDSI